MRRSIVRSMMAAAFTLAGCYTGPSTKDFRPATTPRGVGARIELHHRSLSGELLEVRDTAFVLYDDAGTGLVLLPFSAVAGARFDEIGSYSGGTPDAEWSVKLRQVSRYPYGMSPSVLQALLANAHQAELHVVTQ